MDGNANLSSATLIGYVTLLTQLYKSTISCRSKIVDFNPQNSNIDIYDGKERVRSKSLSDDLSSEEEHTLV